MLELKNIVKDYKLASGNFRALNDVSLKFQKGEFVAILGPSGCGKTTTLNIIGGLDRYTSGDLVINGTSTKDFKEQDWDAYRNNSVGFVFQSYNLINHLSVLDNVELGMTLSGVSSQERRERAVEVLKRVGLERQMTKNPTKLSGGEKQRVAIARALVNNPDIILADEPTGALDSKTAHEILTLIQEISKEKLVIMVTHAPKYADAYASRTVKLLDGQVIQDEGKTVVEEEYQGYEPVKTSMSFFTALKLSFNNLKTKKFRTTITALASSIGIIGVGLVLSIGNGFSKQLDELESDQLVGLPILIGQEEISIGWDQVGASYVEQGEPEENEIIVYDPDDYVHKNILEGEFIDHLDEMDRDIYTTVQYYFGYQPIIMSNHNDVPRIIDLTEFSISSFIAPEDELDAYYSVLAGRLPSNMYEIVLVVKENNVVDISIINSLGLDPDSKIMFGDIIGEQLFVAKNDDIYTKTGNFYTPNYNDLVSVRNQSTPLDIVGIVTLDSSSASLGNDNGFKYLYELEAELISKNVDSDICLDQSLSNDSVLGLGALTEDEKQGFLSFLGCNDTNPYLIQIYTDSVEHKEMIKDYIDEYNEGKTYDEMIYETDLAEAIGNTLSTLITSISAVLSAFASISLVVSSVMIGIIIYISVLERTKEIGIIRSLGGRKKDISRVFNAESVIIGAFAGLLGVTLTFILTFPINFFAARVDESLSSVAQVNPLHLIGLILISTFLTFVGGFIPSRIAAKKDPVEALRVE